LRPAPERVLARLLAARGEYLIALTEPVRPSKLSLTHTPHLGWCLGDQRGHGRGLAVLVQRNHGQIGRVGVPDLACPRVLRLHAHPDLHRGAPGGVDRGAERHQLAHADGVRQPHPMHDLRAGLGDRLRFHGAILLSRSRYATCASPAKRQGGCDAGPFRAHVHRNQSQDLKTARPRRGSFRDARLQLPEADGASAERQEGNRRRRHVEEAAAAPGTEVARSAGKARHAGSPGARAGQRGSGAHGARAQERDPDRAAIAGYADRQLEQQQEQMTASEQKLRTKLEQFRSKKEVIKAQYSAAEAQVRISEAATGVGEEMADVGLAMQRALDKTENMKARADAVQELEAAGTFEDLTALGSGEDDIDRQLKQLSSQSEVDSELAKMKAELGSGSSAPAGELGSGSGAEQSAAAPNPGGEQAQQ